VALKFSTQSDDQDQWEYRRGHRKAHRACGHSEETEPESVAMDEIVKDFLTESRENLDRLDQELVRLEWEHSAKESLETMVRSIHTIKGTSGFLGFPHGERVTRARECLLTRLRDGQLLRTAEISRRLAAMAAAVRQMDRMEKMTTQTCWRS